MQHRHKKTSDPPSGSQPPTPGSFDLSPRSSWWRHLIEPVAALLHQGMSERELSKALALGCTTGISPLIGTTTATGSLLALLLRLNPVACLSANYGVYPLQVALVLPFAQLGHQLTNWPNLPISPSQIKLLFQERGLGALEVLGTTLGNATIAWLLFTPLIFFVSYSCFHRLLQRWPKRLTHD